MTLLQDGDPDPVIARDFGAHPRFLLVCDHAGRAIPQALGDLGVPAEAFARHIAWDIGGLGLAEALARRLKTTMVAQAYSRLVIDCNRDPSHPGSIPPISDGVPIPGNRGLEPDAALARVAAIHQPYHEAIEREMNARLAREERPLLVCVHSFTPAMNGFERPWHVGVLHGADSPLSEALLALLRTRGDLVVGDNQPYAMDGTDYTGPTHAWARGLDMLELEIRQDLIADAAGQERFAALFGDLLPKLPGA